jgi:hypothetical protein
MVVTEDDEDLLLGKNTIGSIKPTEHIISFIIPATCFSGTVSPSLFELSEINSHGVCYFNLRPHGVVLGITGLNETRSQSRSATPVYTTFS